MPGYRHIGRPSHSPQPPRAPRFPVNPPSWEDSDLTADDLRAHRELSNSVDTPSPVSAASHVAYDPRPALTFVPGFGYAPPRSETALRASLVKARRQARLRRTLQIVIPLVILIASYPVAAFLAQLAGNPVP